MTHNNNIMRLFLLTSIMRVLERNASDGVNPIILIQFGSLYLTRLVDFCRKATGIWQQILAVNRVSLVFFSGEYIISARILTP